MKKLLALFLALTAAASLFGCGEQVPEETVPTTEPTAGATMEDGWHDETDHSGAVIRRVRYEQGNPVEAVVLEDGREVSFLTYSYTGTGELDCICQTDLEDRLVSRTDYVQGKPVWRNEFIYDDAIEPTEYGTELKGCTSEILNENGEPVQRIELEGGYLNMEEEWFTGGQEKRCIRYTYDGQGQPPKETQEPVMQNQEYRIFYIYDREGRLLRVYSSQDGLEYRAQYDDQGRIEYEVNFLGPESDGHEYTYDQQGRCSSQYIGATYGYSNREYDEQGRLTLEVQYGDDNEYYREAVRYNEYSDIVEKVCVDQGIYESVYTYEYTYLDGKWTQQTVCCDGQQIEKTVRTYDNDGRLLKEAGTDWDITYAYDAQGRLLTKTVNGDVNLDDIRYSTSRYMQEPSGNKAADGDYNICRYLGDYENGNSCTTYTYNAEGQLSERECRLDDGWTDHYYYTYDHQGRLFQEILCQSD